MHTPFPALLLAVGAAALPAQHTQLPPELESYVAHIAAAEGALRHGAIRDVRRWLDAVPAEQRGFEWRWLDGEADRSARTLTAHDGEQVMALAVAPDGKRFATGGADGRVRIWDACSFALQRDIAAHDGAVYSLAWDPAGARLVSGAATRRAKVWDAATGAELAVFAEHGAPVTTVRFAPDGARIASTGYTRPVGGEVRIWDPRDGRELQLLQSGFAPITCAHWHSDGGRVVAASWDQHLHVFDLQQPDQPLIRRLGAEPEYRAAQCSALSPDGELVAVGCKDDLVHVFRAWSGEHVRDLAGHDKWVEGVAFSPDGARIASGSADLSIRLWDVATGAERARLYGHESVVADLAFLPDGKLLSASHDGTVRVWDAEQAGRRRIDGFAAPAYHGVESPDGKTLAVGFADGSLRLYATATGRETRALREGGGWVNWLVWSADGARLLSAGQDGIEVHRIADGVREHELTEAKGVDAAAWSADGGLVAAVSRDHKVRVWELPAARLRWELDVGKTQYGIAFAPDGARLATVGSAGVFVHDVVDGAIEQRLAGHRGRTRAVQFAPDGALLASAGDDATVRLWRTSDWQPAGVLDAHDNGVRCLSFSPDGRRLATGGADDRLVVWDVASRAATLRLDANDMYCLSWARTGERLWVVPIQRYAFRMDG